MLFYKVSFLVFMAVVFTAYWTTPGRTVKKLLLLAGSYYFYASWNVYYLSLIVISTLTDYLCGMAIQASASRRAKRLALFLSLIVNLGILGAFKYFNFFSESFSALMSMLGFETSQVTLDVLLPVGISFYTFQTMSYTIDVYRGRLRATRNALDFAVYVAFFPQLVAGPIVRARDFLPQMRRPKHFSSRMISIGLGIFILGMLKKIFLADLVAILHVDIVFGNVAQFNGVDVLMAVYGYALQIYADFSGYSDMAIGVALMLGYRLGRNFDHPYLAANARSFWRRWHISLSTWLRDYLYIPLGGSRCGPLRRVFNLFVTMLLGGLWHGAALKFVLWGGFHGAMVGASHLGGSIVRKLRISKFVGVVITFHLVCLGWILFRVQSAGDVVTVLHKLVSIRIGDFRGAQIQTLSCCIILAGLGYHFANHFAITRRIRMWLLRYSVVANPAIVCSIVFLALFAEDMKNTFIYFQF